MLFPICGCIVGAGLDICWLPLLSADNCELTCCVRESTNNKGFNVNCFKACPEIKCDVTINVAHVFHSFVYVDAEGLCTITILYWFQRILLLINELLEKTGARVNFLL